MLGRCCSTLLHRYATFLYNYPYIFLILTPIFFVICGIFSFVPAVGPEAPNFSKPTEGFEPRGTEIMKRIVTQQDTLKDAINSEELTCVPKQSARRKRSIPQLSSKICSNYTYRHFSIVTVYESGGDLFNVDDLKTICSMEERIVRRTPGFNLHCSCLINGQCGPSLSLGNYIAISQNRSSCNDLTQEDVSYARRLLKNCSSAYLTGKLSKIDTPKECINNSDLIQNIFNLLVDVDFPRNTNNLKNTMVLSPVLYDPDFARDIYDQYLSNARPEQNGVKLVAFEFGDFKFDQFNSQLLLDAVFPVIGLIMVAIILLIYTHSVLVMALTIFSVITSIIIAYFIYHHIFRLTFFPFLNILTVIFLIGISADDAFVFNDVWAQAKSALPRGSVTDWLEYTLKHAALSMFVTSFTTAAAFYANIVSDITAIRLFGIFSGTSILILYALMISWFPAGVVFMEKRRRSRIVVRENLPLQQNHPLQPTINISDREPDGGEFPSKSNPSCTLAVPTNPKRTSSNEDLDDSSTQMTENSPRPCPCRYYNIVRSKCSSFIRNLFAKWIPTSLRGYPIFLIAFLALGIGMICAVTVSPGLQRPKSADFQVFSSSHILEQYDLKYKHKFRLASVDRNNFVVYIFFGFKAEDNGDYLKPKDFGKLEYDDSFDVLHPDAQKWILENLCSDIRNEKVFGRNISWSCFFEIFRQECNRTLGANYSLPLNKIQLFKCIEQYYKRRTSVYCNEYSGGIYFQGSQIKGIGLPFPTNIPYTTEYATVNSLWEDIKDFQSNVLDKAPEGLQNGWAVSWLRFYALQLNLGSGTIASLGVSLAIALCVMLLTSLNWVISLYAIVTIICILATTIGSLVLDGWELNILESIVISVAVGLSVDFTLHYGVAYTISSENGRVNQVKYALGHIGPAVTLAAITTFIAGAFMMFSTVLVYFQLGQFLTLVMASSWVFATFFFMSLCYFAGPVGHFGQINSTKCGSCKVID